MTREALVQEINQYISETLIWVKTGIPAGDPNDPTAEISGSVTTAEIDEDGIITLDIEY